MRSLSQWNGCYITSQNQGQIIIKLYFDTTKSGMAVPFMDLYMHDNAK